ncbi:MAG TPA: DUF115 domain-containing protein [Bacillota bacterium]|nr:DUF115 domain-containing protein [Bacillota bacterium]
MNFYTQNIDFIRSQLKTVYDTVVKDESQYPSKVALSGPSNIKVELDQKSCMLHSDYSTEREIREMFSAVDESAEALVVFGMGLWHCRKHIFDTYKNLRQLIIIEPDLHIFKEALHRVDMFDPTGSNADLSLVVNRSAEESLSLICDILQLESIVKIDLAYSLSYRSLFPDYYETIQRGIVTQLRVSTINYATSSAFLYQWTRNNMMNYRHKAIPVTKFINRFEDIPVIIVSAGPSLNYNMHYLREVRDKAVIIAVGSAIKILDSNGIVPHFRMAADGGETEEKIFGGIDTGNIPLFFSDTLYYKILEQYQGVKIRMALTAGALEEYIFKELYGELFLINSGFSIANIALDLALKLGAKKIILMGQDLSYTEGSLYAKGSWKQDEAIDFEKSRYIKTANTRGETVYTDKPFLGMRDLFEDLIRVNPGPIYINATERGLNIEGTVNKPFERVMEEDLRESRNINELINDLIRENEIDDDSWNQKIEALDFSEMIKELSEVNEYTLKKLTKLKKQAEKDAATNKLKRDLDEIEEYAAKQMDELEFYRATIKPALQTKLQTLQLNHQYHGPDMKEAFDTNFKLALGKATEIKIYLEFLKIVIEERDGSAPSTDSSEAAE